MTELKITATDALPGMTGSHKKLSATVSDFFPCVSVCETCSSVCSHDVHSQLSSFKAWIEFDAWKELFLRGKSSCSSKIWRLLLIFKSQPLMSDNECWRRHKENFWCKIRGNSETQGHLISQNLPNKRAVFLMYFDYAILCFSLDFHDS